MRSVPAHRSPSSATRSGMFRRLNVSGSTSPRSISSHVHGADTGAPRFARTVYGAANVALYDAQALSGGKSVAGDMMNAKVQVYGDVAILTYNYVGVVQQKDGKTDNNAAKSTRVYAKIDGQWKLVHANFAPVVPPSD